MDKDGAAHPSRRWAELRFSVVGRLLAAPPPRGELQGELEELAKKVWKDPTNGGPVLFGVSTIQRWYYRAKDASDPVGALTRKVRTDAGREKAMSAALLMALKLQYTAHPGWSYQLHADNLVALVQEDPARYGEAPSYSTVRRRMVKRGWLKRRRRRNPTSGQRRAAQRLEQLEVRSFESEFVHAVWHYDFHQGSLRVVDSAGEWHTPMALCILDDCSRLVCHMQWYLGETAHNLVHGLSQALGKRGLPRSVLHDNGSAMLAAETLGGLSRLGIESAPTLPYSPYQNGKQEKFWDTAEGRLMAMLEAVDPLTLAFLNRATQAWVEREYNRRKHDELGCSPLDRMLNGEDVSRPAPDGQALRLAFCTEGTRIQRRSDGTVSLQGVRFELPSRLRTLHRVRLRYARWDLSRAWIVDPRTQAVLARVQPQDKTKNADRQRRALAPIDELPAVDDTPTDPLPPLMRRLLAEQEATGLPPAYLPVDEPPPHDQGNNKDNDDD